MGSEMCIRDRPEAQNDESTEDGDWSYYSDGSTDDSVQELSLFSTVEEITDEDEEIGEFYIVDVEFNSLD